jgi:hypothetical protein
MAFERTMRTSRLAVSNGSLRGRCVLGHRLVLPYRWTSRRQSTIAATGSFKIRSPKARTATDSLLRRLRDGMALGQTYACRYSHWLCHLRGAHPPRRGASLHGLTASLYSWGRDAQSKGLATMANILMGRWERRAAGADTEAETLPGNVHIAQAYAPRNGSEAETIPVNVDILQPHSPHSCASAQLEVDSE